MPSHTTDFFLLLHVEFITSSINNNYVCLFFSSVNLFFHFIVKLMHVYVVVSFFLSLPLPLALSLSRRNFRLPFACYEHYWKYLSKYLVHLFMSSYIIINTIFKLTFFPTIRQCWIIIKINMVSIYAFYFFHTKYIL